MENLQERCLEKAELESYIYLTIHLIIRRYISVPRSFLALKVTATLHCTLAGTLNYLNILFELLTILVFLYEYILYECIVQCNNFFYNSYEVLIG